MQYGNFECAKKIVGKNLVAISPMDLACKVLGIEFKVRQVRKVHPEVGKTTALADAIVYSGNLKIILLWSKVKAI